MKSIRTKISILILVSIFLTVFLIGGAGVLTVQKLVTSDSHEIMNLICKKNALELDTTFACIEQSVETLAFYTLDHLNDINSFKTDPDYIDKCAAELQEVTVNAANNTDGAIAVYVRFNTEFASSTSGIFWSRTGDNKKFVKQDPTDILLYEENDIEHVGWYYMPRSEQKAVWMPPYYNKNIDIPMVSYVIPMYVDDVFLGIVGMDIDYNLIMDKIDDMQVYNTGYAFLIDEQNVIMHHPKYERGTKMIDLQRNIEGFNSENFNLRVENEQYGYQSNKKNKSFVLSKLKNGMTLILTAPESEIKHDQYELIKSIIVVSILIFGVALFITISVTNRIVKPLIELKIAAQKIANGDLGIEFNYQSNDEVGELTESFKKTVASLREYHSYINNLAYIDSLTGIKNKTAYKKFADKMDEKIVQETAVFAVAVFDVNYLKKVNDSFGHEEGDNLLKEASMMICHGFKHSPVFRIGGDEFVAILENSDFENREQLVVDFDEQTTKKSRADSYEYVSIACGIAVYDFKTDPDFSAVFKRADAAMYEKSKR